MKNRSVIQITLAVILFFNIARGLCYASGIAMGNENATVNFYGEDKGVYYLISDPQGKRTGYDPVSKQEVEEFPAAFDFSLYVIDGVTKFVRDEISEQYHGSADFNLISGTYTLEVFGVALTAYDLNIRIRRIPSERRTKSDISNATPEQIAAIKAMSTDFSFEGVIDKGLTSRFQFTYTSDPSKPAGTATRVATPSSLKQDIILARKVKGIWESVGEAPKLDYLIDNDGIMNSLLKKVEAIEASITKGNKTAAKNQLNALINEVNAQKGKHISEKAVKILFEDAQYIMGNL